MSPRPGCHGREHETRSAPKVASFLDDGNFETCYVSKRLEVAIVVTYFTGIRKEGLYITIYTFYLRLYYVIYLVKDHSTREESCCQHFMGYTSRVILMHNPKYRISHTRAFVVPAVGRLL